MNPADRDELIDQVKYGLMSPDEAEAAAARFGWGPLASRPDPQSYDPMIETWWTLPMAVAWIAWRNPEDVLDCHDPYREQCWDWHYHEWRLGPEGPIHKGHFLEQRQPATLVHLSLADRYNVVTGSKRDAAMGVTDAMEQLWKALQENRLQATGKRRYGDHRQPIADYEWLDLKHFEERGRDVLCSDPITDGGYYNVAVRRQSVTALWPATPASKPERRLPQTIRPDGPGFFPLYCAAQWIATCGGDRDFDPTEAKIWNLAFQELTARIASGHVTVTGIRNGVRERIEGHLFASLRVDHPFLPTPLDMILSDEMYLSTCPYIDQDHWHKGFHDSLQLRAGMAWGKLMVLKSDIANFWPFALDPASLDETRPISSGGPGRPTAMHLVIAEHRKRLDERSAEARVGAESEYLARWLRETHPTAPALTSKTIRNKIAPEHRRAMNSPK